MMCLAYKISKFFLEPLGETLKITFESQQILLKVFRESSAINTRTLRAKRVQICTKQWLLFLLLLPVFPPKLDVFLVKPAATAPKGILSSEENVNILLLREKGFMSNIKDGALVLLPFRSLPLLPPPWTGKRRRLYTKTSLLAKIKRSTRW